MRFPTGVAFVVAFLCVAGPALAASQRDRDQCKDVNNVAAADRNIAACNRILDASRATRRARAIAYGNRCALWNTKREPDRALADCNEAIRLAPKRAFAYNSRGNAYSAKNDLDRAIADYNQAIRLDPKYARAYSNRGDAYFNKGDYDRALADHNEAIRVDPKLAFAYSNRGRVYSNKGDYDRALADYNEAIRLDAKDAFAYSNRGDAYFNKGDYDRALADYNEAIRLDPKYAFTYSSRGRLHLYSGARAKALADLSQASELDPKDAYHALWLDIVGQRNNVPSRLAQAISKIDMAAWPAPVIRMFLGQVTAAALLAAADNPDSVKKNGQVCEANFYSGILELRGGAKDEATRLFRLAARDCPGGFIEWEPANAELKALGVSP